MVYIDFMNMLYMGTCSWNYDSWEGLVYTRKERSAADYLTEYARHFNTAEIDSWFYKIPDPAEAKLYAENTPETFMFTCKVYEGLTLTHERSWNRPEKLSKNAHFLSRDLYYRFLEAIEPAHAKIGLIMFEFEYLNKEKMESVHAFMDQFDDFYANIDKTIPIGIEIRNKNYLTPEYFSFLQAKGIIHVFSEKLYMPPVTEVFARYRDYLGDTLVIRLLGGDRSEIEKKTGNKWNRIVEEKPNKREIIQMSVDSKFDHGKVIINVNNHYEGSAPLTISALRHLYEEYRPASS
jgi:uncharacterized protein YecE (DUF72 family)